MISGNDRVFVLANKLFNQLLWWWCCLDLSTYSLFSFVILTTSCCLYLVRSSLVYQVSSVVLKYHLNSFFGFDTSPLTTTLPLQLLHLIIAAASPTTDKSNARLLLFPVAPRPSPVINSTVSITNTSSIYWLPLGLGLLSSFHHFSNFTYHLFETSSRHCHVPAHMFNTQSNCIRCPPVFVYIAMFIYSKNGTKGVLSILPGLTLQCYIYYTVSNYNILFSNSLWFIPAPLRCMPSFCPLVLFVLERHLLSCGHLSTVW